MSNRSLLPFVASSLNDVYSKLDGIVNQIKEFGTKLDDFTTELNKQFHDSLGKIGEIHEVIGQVDVLKEFKTTTKLFSATLDQINESVWYVDFIIALKRILTVVSEMDNE